MRPIFQYVPAIASCMHEAPLSVVRKSGVEWFHLLCRITLKKLGWAVRHSTGLLTPAFGALAANYAGMQESQCPAEVG